jgi:hypothetical protein
VLLPMLAPPLASLDPPRGEGELVKYVPSGGSPKNVDEDQDAGPVGAVVDDVA